ncbi:MAG: MFS transporter [Chloroflexi bacterium]|nr:MFS transporter [Chloroflexota bacterium]
MKRSANLRLLSWFNFFSFLRLYGVVAVIYFAQITGSYALALSIYSIANIARAAFEIPTGIISDKLGRSICLRLGALASVLSVACYAIGQDYAILVIGAVLEGACLAFFSGNNDALLYESLAEHGQEVRYPEALGRARSAMELAGFLASILGGLIASVSFGVLMGLSMMPQLIALALSFGFRDATVHRRTPENVLFHLKEALSYYMSNWRLRTLSLAEIIGVGMGDAAWSLQAAFYNMLLPIWAVGVMISLNYLASTISFRLSGRLIERFKALNLLLFSAIYSRVLAFIALISPTVFSPLLMASASVTYGPSVVAGNTLLQAEFTDRQRATMASINSLAGGFFFAVMAVLLGAYADRFGTAHALLIAQVLQLPLIGLYWQVFRKTRS